MISFSHHREFATQALLEQTEKASSVVSDGSLFEAPKAATSPKRGMKRSLTVAGSFDMSEFLKVSQQVEDSISFPSIEWPSFDDEEDESEDEFRPARQSSKRQCRGLVRCNRSSNLCSLVEMASHHQATERRGSSGSLS
jgi:hypothetical protein